MRKILSVCLGMQATISYCTAHIQTHANVCNIYFVYRPNTEVNCEIFISFKICIRKYIYVGCVQCACGRNQLSANNYVISVTEYAHVINRWHILISMQYSTILLPYLQSPLNKRNIHVLYGARVYTA